jgi:hypothetical protein
MGAGVALDVTRLWRICRARAPPPRADSATRGALPYVTASQVIAGVAVSRMTASGVR